MYNKTRVYVTMFVTILMVLVPFTSVASDPFGPPNDEILPDEGPGSSADSRAADFTLTRVGLQMVMMGQGANTWWLIEVTSLEGFNDQVNFSVSGMPLNTNHYFYPSNVTPPANGKGSVFFRVNTTTATSAGWYPITVTGTSGSLSHDVDITLNIINNAFVTGEITPFEVNAAPGDTVNLSMLLETQKGCSGSCTYNKMTDDGLGSTVTFDPASPSNLPLNSIKVIKVSVGVPGGASPGTYNHLIWGLPSCMAGSNGFGLGFKVNVFASNSFALQGRPWIQSVAAGEATTFSFDVQSFGTFNEDVDLDITSVLPDGVTAEFDPSTVTPDAGSKNTTTLTVETSEDTRSGIYPLTANGTSTSLEANSTIYLWVTNEPDFTITGTPSSQFVTPGNSVSYKIILSSLKGFDDTVNLTLQSPPEDATVTLGSDSKDLDENETVAIDLKVTAGALMALGTYIIRVQANNTTLLHSTDLTLKVVNTLPSDFNITVEPVIISANSFTGYDYDIDLGSLNGFSGTVDLSVEGVPKGTKVDFNTSSIDLPSDGTGEATLTVTPSASTPIGNFIMTVVSESGDKKHDAKVLFKMLGVPGVIITPDPDPVTILAGSFAKVTLTLNSTKGFVGNVDFSGVTLPAGFSATFVPVSVTVNGTTIMNISVEETVPAGDRTLSFEGEAGANLFPCRLRIKVQNFSLSSPEPLQRTMPGGTATYTVNVTGGNGFGGDVVISVEGLPANITPALTGTPVTTPGSATIELTVAEGVAVGIHAFRAMGLTQGVEREVDLFINLTDFGVATNPTAIELLPGHSMDLDVTVLSIEGFNDTVGLIANTVGPITLNLVAPSVDAPGSTILQLTAASGAVPGVYNVTVKATYGDYERTTNVTVTVQDFSLGIDPLVAMAGRGGSVVYTVTVQGIQDYSGAIGLTMFDAPADIVASFDPGIITPSETSTLTIQVGDTASLGNRTLTLRGINGTHYIETTFHLWVTNMKLVANPSTHTLLVGEVATSSISIAEPAGVPGGIVIEVRDVPEGAKISLDPDLNPPEIATLTIDTANMTAGNYTVTVGILGAGDNGATKVDIIVQDFGIVIDPETVTIIRGQTAIAKVTLAPENGFDREVTIKLTTTDEADSPEADLLLGRLRQGEEAELTVEATETTRLGTHAIEVASIQPAIRTAEFSVTVSETPEKGFDFTIEPAKLEVRAGKSGSYTITVNAIGDFSEVVEFSVSGLPAGASANWSSLASAPPATIQLNIETTKDMAPDEYDLTVTGKAGSLQISKDVVLKVLKPKKHVSTDNLFSLLPWIILIVIICAVIVVGVLYARRRRTSEPPGGYSGPPEEYPQAPATHPSETYEGTPTTEAPAPEPGPSPPDDSSVPPAGEEQQPPLPAQQSQPQPPSQDASGTQQMPPIEGMNETAPPPP